MNPLFYETAYVKKLNGSIVNVAYNVIDSENISCVTIGNNETFLSTLSNIVSRAKIKDDEDSVEGLEMFGL